LLLLLLLLLLLPLLCVVKSEGGRRPSEASGERLGLLSGPAQAGG
jgi:hypothetical protein